MLGLSFSESLLEAMHMVPKRLLTSCSAVLIFSVSWKILQHEREREREEKRERETCIK